MDQDTAKLESALEVALEHARAVDRDCYELYCKGMTYRAIGKALGFSGTRAYQRVRRHLIRHLIRPEETGAI